MPFFMHDGLSFHYRDEGEGLPFVFQHGLGGDLFQPFGLFKPPDGVRLIAFDCRAHGLTHPVGDETKIAFSDFAADLRTLLDQLEIEKAVVGGISMGAALSLRFVRMFPERVLGLVLSRPAWLQGPTPNNLRRFGKIAALLRAVGPEVGANQFADDPDFNEVAEAAPDCAQSLLGQFKELRAIACVARLERIPADDPGWQLHELARIAVPTLVLANQRDPVHPYEFGAALASAIPGARFETIASKSDDVQQHAADVNRYIGEFLSSLRVKE